MTSRYAQIVWVLLLCAKITLGQHVDVQMSARSAGLGYATTSLDGVWSLHGNPAGLSALKYLSCAFAYERQPALEAGDRTAAVISVPSGNGGAAVGAFRFGDELYSEESLSFGYSNRFGLASIGARVDVVQYRTEGYGIAHAISLTAGTMAYLSEHVVIGGCVSNVAQRQLNQTDKLPIKMTAGVMLRPSEKVVVVADLEKDIEYSPTVRAGIEYNAASKVHVRTGFNLFPNKAFAGIGLACWRLTADYAITYSNTLSYTHQVSIAIRTRELKKSSR